MRRIFLWLVVVIGATSAPLASAGAASPSAPWGYGGGTTPAASHPMPLGPRAQATSPGEHLSYLGGPVISHVSVQSVFWGAGQYQDGVRTPMSTCPSTAPCTMAEYFQGVTDSVHLDWLDEYNTVNQPTREPLFPGQHIGRGTFQGETTISVSPANATATISDHNISDELDRQLSSGALPQPQLDDQGQVQTVYAVFFPQTITISDGGMVGGEPGGFCAYHSTFDHDGVPVAYLVLPDFESHHFAEGCGTDPTLFNNFTGVASHELVETITDPLVGLGVWSWLDNSGDEIADICQPNHSTLSGRPAVGNGLTVVVQQEWDNTSNSCIGTRPFATPPRDGYVDACGLAGRIGFADAGYAADCLKQYGISQGKNDGTFGENDGLLRSQVSSLLARLVELSGAVLAGSRTFPDVTVDSVPNAQVRTEIEELAASGIIAGYEDGGFHPTDNLSVAQATALVTRTLQFIHTHNAKAPDVVDQGSTSADYSAAVEGGLLNRVATNLRGFVYGSESGDETDRGLLADILAESTQRLVDALVIVPASSSAA